MIPPLRGRDKTEYEMDELVRISKGIWIPIEIWTDKDLSWNEKILLMEIDSYTAKGKDCYMSDEFVGELLGVHPKSANRILNSLIEKGLVERTGFDGRKRHIRSTLCYCRGNTNVTADSTPTLPQTPQLCYHTNISIPNKITKQDNKPPLSPLEKKVVFADGVKLTEEEFARLCGDFGEDLVRESIQFLSDYKKEKGYKTKSDNLTLRRWVIDAVRKKKAEQRSVPKKDTVQDMFNYINQKYGQ